MRRHVLIGMKAQFLSTALMTVFAGALPAVDSQLLNLVMPDATVVAGVNVTQAKTSPFGQYVLSQIQPNDPKLQELVTLTGFDPRQDVNELLVASDSSQTSGPQSKTGLVLATGIFNVPTITSFAASHQAASENPAESFAEEMATAAYRRRELLGQVNASRGERRHHGEAGEQPARDHQHAGVWSRPM